MLVGEKLDENDLTRMSAGGLHAAIKTEYFRIGHMGVSVTELHRGHLEKTISAVAQGLAECGDASFDRDAPMTALRSVLASQ